MNTAWISGEVDAKENLIIAHRGAPRYSRENTIESFEKAMVSGADMIEFDVRRTKDNVLIAFHDELIQGYCIKDLTYDEIGRMGKEEGYEREIVELLCRYLEEDQFVITSFNDASLRVIIENRKSIATNPHHLTICLWAFCGGHLLHYLCCSL